LKEGLGICGEALAENHTAIHLARPLNPADMLIAETSIEFDEMSGLFGSVHGELDEAGLFCPLLGALKEHTANACTLMLWIDCKLVCCRNTGASEVLALILGVGGLGNDCSDELGVGFDHEAVAAANAFGSDFGCLIHCGVVQPHVAKTSICSVEQ